MKGCKLVRYGVLAIDAAHKSFLGPGQSSLYQTASMSFMTLSVHFARAVWENVTVQNRRSLFSFLLTTVVNYLAMPIYSHDGRLPTPTLNATVSLSIIQGIDQVCELVRDSIPNSEQAPFIASPQAYGKRLTSCQKGTSCCIVFYCRLDTRGLR